MAYSRLGTARMAFSAPTGIDEPRRWLHCLQLRGSDQPLRPWAQNEVDRQDVSRLEEFLLRDQPRPARSRLFFREILAPSDYFHTEREADARNLRAKTR